MIGPLRLLALWLAVVAGQAGSAGTAAERWLLIDTQTLTLHLMQGGRPQFTLHDISIGRYGPSATKRRGDNTTPLGRFHITGIRLDGGFHRFIALDYPDLARAERAFREGRLGRADLQRIAAAHRRGDRPPQDTVLGGHIGIHGLGRADPDVHAALNWTRGCVALTDRQIDELLPWVTTGMAVEIR